MKRFASLYQRQNRELFRTLVRAELSLMEQGTPLGFVLSFVNNAVMLLMFHTLFVDRFLVGVPNPIIYLLLGIAQWNLYIQVSMAGFGCFIYRQKIVMGYAFPREILVLARTATVFIPYLLELSLIVGIAAYMGSPPGWNYWQLPLLLVAQFLFCAGLCSVFAFVGVLHKNIIPFWNIMFRLLSFATPIFYLPIHFRSTLVNEVYGWNPFTIFMIWIREIVGVNGFSPQITPWQNLGGAALVFIGSYALFRLAEGKVGDNL